MASVTQPNSDDRKNDQAPLDVAAIASATSDWKEWSSHLSKRKQPRPLRKLLSRDALFWGCSTKEIIHLPEAARLLQLKKHDKPTADFEWSEAFESWLETTKQLVSFPMAVTSIAWAHATPYLIKCLPPEQWRTLVTALCELTNSSSAESETTGFLIHVELPLTLAYALPEISVCHTLRKAGRANFSQSMDSMLDGEGMPHAKHVETIHRLLASCTRSLTLDAEIKKGRVDKATRLHFDWLCRQTLRWSRVNGTNIFQNAADSPFFYPMLNTALKLTDDDADKLAFKTLRGKRSPQVYDDTPEPSEHSEWAGLSTSRTSWSAKATCFAVNFYGQEMAMELAVADDMILRGSSMPRLVIGGDHLQPLGHWEEVCWESDDDMDYLEYEIIYPGGWKFQRQMLLAREDNFLLLADAVLGDEPDVIEYTMPLPLVPDVIIEQDADSNEASILGKRRLGTIIPLSLPEWKAELFDQRLRLDPARLEIKRTDRALYAPLFFDLDKRRSRKPLTWRRLSVGENLQSVSEDTAVAFRIQIGKEQWVIYRSLDRPGNRTFLGQNLICDFCVGRFTTDGQLESLVNVEA